MIAAHRGGWLAVWYTPDGPFVQGPYEGQDAAKLAILYSFIREGKSRDLREAFDRYESTGDEWVTRLQPAEEGS